MSLEVLVLFLFTYGCVADDPPEQVKLFVNRVEQSHIVAPFLSGSNDTSKYRYVDGDTVDVSCISEAKSCLATIKYDDVGNIGCNGTLKRSFYQKHAYNGVGLRTTLHKAHDQTNLTCEFSCYNGIIRLEMQFILQNSNFKDQLNITINGYNIRFQTPIYNCKNKPCYVLYYFSGDSLTFAHGSEDVNIFEEHFIDHTTVRIENKLFSYSPNYLHALKYELQDKFSGLQSTIYIYFKELSQELKDSRPLMIDASNTTLELYQFVGDKEIYYEYEDDNGSDSRTFKCNTLYLLVPSSGWHLEFGNKVAYDNNEIILSTANNTPVNCSLYDANEVLSRQIRLYFIKKINPLVESETDSGLSTVVLPAVGCVVTIMVISVLVAVYYKKKRNLQTDSVGDKIQPKLVDNSKPSPPDTRPMEPLYSVPEKHIHDESTYSEVRLSEPETSQYANIRITQQPEETRPELNYAILDISPSVRINKKLDAVESPYAEVLYNVNACL